LNLKDKIDFEIIQHDFDIWRTTFSKLKTFQQFFIFLNYQFYELLFFWKIVLKIRPKHIILSVDNPEELLFLFLTPIRTTYVIHTPTTDTLDKLKKIILKFCLSPRKNIICVSDYARNLLIKSWGLPKYSRRVAAIHNYYDQKEISKERFDFKGKTVLTIGSLHFYKNPVFWLEIAKDITKSYNGDVSFVWAGDGPFLIDCKLAAAEYKNIYFLGHVEDVVSLYLTSTIYFQPSLLESQGISVLGAMFHGLPCVVSDTGGLPESVSHNLNGYVINVNSKDHALQSINTLLLSEDLSDSMGLNSKIIYNQKFSHEIWDSKMNELILH
jgi:glycosyltransferase involved in cell wall biosynthesis